MHTGKLRVDAHLARCVGMAAGHGKSAMRHCIPILRGHGQRYPETVLGHFGGLTAPFRVKPNATG
jgi:hypothetical protein